MVATVLRQVCIGSACAVAPLPQNAYRPYLLRHPALAFVSAMLVAAKLGVILLVALTPDVASLSTISAAFLTRQTNEARREAGIPILEEHPLLATSARLKGQDMLTKDYFEHTSPQGATPWTWFDDAGYAYVVAGENLAIDFTSGEAVHEAWMRSAGHRRNILNSQYRHIGIAVVTGEFNGTTTTIIVQHLGSLTGAAAEAAPETPARAEQPGETPRPSPQPTPSPATPPPPEILEPSEGKLLPSGASTVRGSAAAGSTVTVKLDGDAVGTYPAPRGAFHGTFTPPSEEEREATLIAISRLGGRASPPSAPRRVVLDTRGPLIAQESALLLPDPLGTVGSLLLIVPLQGDVRSARARIGSADLPLRLTGSVASATLPTRDASAPIVVHAEDDHGNRRVATIEPLRRFRVVPRTAGESDARIRVNATAENVRTVFASVLTIVALLLAINILVSIRIQHADLIAHALFVLVLGGILSLIT